MTTAKKVLERLEIRPKRSSIKEMVKKNPRNNWDNIFMEVLTRFHSSDENKNQINESANKDFYNTPLEKKIRIKVLIESLLDDGFMFDDNVITGLAEGYLPDEEFGGNNPAKFYIDRPGFAELIKLMRSCNTISN